MDSYELLEREGEGSGERGSTGAGKTATGQWCQVRLDTEMTQLARRLLV